LGLRSHVHSFRSQTSAKAGTLALTHTGTRGALATDCADVRVLIGQNDVKNVDMQAVAAGRARAAEQFALAGQPSHDDLKGDRCCM
jgi:hypothetical protein